MTINQVKEKWVPVLGFERLYQISNLGRVRKLKTRYNKKILILKQAVKDYHLRVLLVDDLGSKSSLSVGQLILESFSSTKRPIGSYIEYIDSNFLNCTYYNVRYKIIAEHLQATNINKLHPNIIRGSSSKKAVLTEAQVLKMREDWYVFTKRNLDYGVAKKYMQKEAIKYKCSYINIYSVIHKLTWRWL